MILIMHHSLLVNSKEVAIGTRLLVAAIDGVGVTIVSPPHQIGLQHRLRSAEIS
jgi:hypothetical protein